MAGRLPLCESVSNAVVLLFLRRYLPELSDTVRLSAPIMIAQLGVVLMGVTDTLFVGRLLGSVALGAAGLANSLAFLVASIGVGAMSVVAALISESHSRHDSAAIGRLYRAGLWSAAGLSVVLGGASAGVAYMLGWFGQSADVTLLARQFMYVMSVSVLPLLVFTAARQLCDGLRRPRVAMMITLSALGVNALFNYVLIVGVGPFPAMGLIGSALATLISRVYMALAMLLYIHRHQVLSLYVYVPAVAQPLWPVVRKVLRLGIPGGLTFFFEIAAFSLAVVMIGWLGEAQLAAHQIAINMASVTYMMATGISSAGAIRVGAAVGRGSRVGVWRAGVAAFGLSLALMSLTAVLFLTANEWLVSLYIRDDAEVMRIAASLLLIAGFFQLSDGVQVVALGCLRGLSDVNVPTLITLFAYWVVALPLGFVLAFRLHQDVMGVWIGLLIGLTIAAVLLTMRFVKRTRNIQTI